MTQPVGDRYVPGGFRLLLVVAAVVLFIIYACFGAGWFTGGHPTAFLGFGLAALAASQL
jgi:hypothetical protein